MKRRGIILIIFTIFTVLLFNVQINSRKVVLCSGIELVHTQNNNNTETIFPAAINILQVILPENQFSANGSLIQRTIKTNMLQSQGICTKNKITLFYFSYVYKWQSLYICSKLKKADILFPFHFFL